VLLPWMTISGVLQQTDEPELLKFYNSDIIKDNRYIFRLFYIILNIFLL
jgi:hypothetical protein